MDFMQHIPNEVLRIFLRDELPAPQKDVVRLHLSFCPICQEQQDELVLDDLVPHVVAVFEQRTFPKDGHIEERVLKQFWKGTIKEESQIERISDHCLSCSVCRDKRYEVWLSLRKESALAKAVAAIGFSILPALAVRSRQRRTRGPKRNVRRAVISLIATLLLAVVLIPVWTYLGREDAPPLSAKVQEQGGAANDAPLPIESPQMDAPVNTPVPTPSGLVERPAHIGTSARHKAKPKPRDATRARVVDTTELSGRREEAQNLNFDDSTEDLSVRGADEADTLTKTPSIISLPRGDTPLLIELPEHSRKGWYEVSLRDLANLDSPLDTYEVESSDGKQIYVLLNLRKLPEKVYQLRITRKDEETGADTELRYMSVLVSRPKRRGGGS